MSYELEPRLSMSTRTYATDEALEATNWSGVCLYIGGLQMSANEFPDINWSSSGSAGSARPSCSEGKEPCISAGRKHPSSNGKKVKLYEKFIQGYCAAGRMNVMQVAIGIYHARA